VPTRERLGHRTEEARLLRVQPGDTLWTIAQAHGVSVADLLRANDLGRDALIRTGQTLRLPR
jgi:LysM repeat protein